MFKNIIAMCAIYYGSIYGVDPDIIKAVAKVESNNNPSAISPDKHDIGLLQIRKKYVKESREQLLDTCKNIEVGARIMSMKMRECKHHTDFTWLVCYNAGVTGGSKITKPRKFPYYKKVMEAYNAIDY